MVKIVQILPALGWGGAQVFCIQLCNELAKYPDYEVTLVSLYDHNPNHMSMDLIDRRIRFVTLGKIRGLDVTIFAKVQNLIRKVKPQVVHTHLHAGYYATWAYLRMKDNHIKKVHTFHSLVTKDAPFHGRLLYKYFFRGGIITPVSISEEVLKGAIAEYGSSFTTLIHNGSAPVKPTAKFDAVQQKINSLKPTQNTKVLVNIGRIYKVKNQQLILESMRHLEQEDVIALILGDYLPDEKKFYDQLIETKPPNVHFLGKVKNVGDYLLNANGFLLSSLYEGLPISLLEAMSAGATPICTPVGGLLDIVKPDIGFLSKDLTTESFLAAIKAFLAADDHTINTLQNNAKTLYQNEFSIESCAAKYNKLYFN